MACRHDKDCMCWLPEGSTSLYKLNATPKLKWNKLDSLFPMPPVKLCCPPNPRKLEVWITAHNPYTVHLLSLPAHKHRDSQSPDLHTPSSSQSIFSVSFSNKSFETESYTYRNPKRKVDFPFSKNFTWRAQSILILLLRDLLFLLLHIIEWISTIHCFSCPCRREKMCLEASSNMVYLFLILLFLDLSLLMSVGLDLW